MYDGRMDPLTFFFRHFFGSFRALLDSYSNVPR